MDLLVPKLSALVSFFCLHFLLMSRSTEGAKILLLTIPTGSHLLTFLQLGEALAERGHVLHSVFNQDCKGMKKLAKIGIINHPYTTNFGCIDDNQEMEELKMKMVVADFNVMQIREMMKGFARLVLDDLAGLFSDNMVHELKEENFDIVVLNAIIFSRAFYILPYRLGLPVISIAAVTPLLDTGVPALPSFTPTMRQGTFTDRMTFSERVQNTLLSLFLDPATAYFLEQGTMVSKYAPEMPLKTLSELQADSALWLIMNEIAIDYPQVSLPHVINVGGINTGPAKPLKPDFQRIADEAKDGLVLVSFGSSIGDFPSELRINIYKGLKQVKLPLIWRYTGERPDDVPANMHIVDWMPQNDLLAHPNTKVFVTHCGCNGQFEALYSGVPMVGIPIFGDQKYNAIRMVNKGMGVMLGLRTFRPEELTSAVEEVHKNQSYREAMKKYSAIFRNHPMKPMERAMYWIEHVLEYGHEHLRSAGVDLPWYQYWCIDVVLFLMTVIVLALSLFVLIVYFIFRKCCTLYSYLKRKSASQKPKRQ